LWELALSGVAHIKNNILSYELVCDYQVQDTFIAASSNKGFAQEVAPEFEMLRSFNYESTLYTQDEITHVLGSEDFCGGVRYPGTFGINAYLYLQSMAQILRTQGVEIYEESPALSISGNTVTTAHGSVTAQYIVSCMDRWSPDLAILKPDVTTMQTYLLCSAPLKEHEIKAIFPDKPLMVWDTELVFNYFRLAYDNRLLLGGSNLFNTYVSKAGHDNYAVFKKLSNYFKKKFPQVSCEFQYMWPGLIGVSKDIMPLAGRDKKNPALYSIAATAGLPWAAALGRYSAESLLEGRFDFDQYFSPYRHFSYGPLVQKVLGKKITFALSHITTLESF
jgi:gamma-glutamylputrescine oxidase